MEQKDFIKEYDFKFKKKYGQNFLTDDNILNNISNTTCKSLLCFFIALFVFFLAIDISPFSSYFSFVVAGFHPCPRADVEVRPYILYTVFIIYYLKKARRLNHRFNFSDFQILFKFFSVYFYCFYCFIY